MSAPASDVVATLTALVRARYSLVDIASVEEARVEAGLRQVVQAMTAAVRRDEGAPIPLWIWSFSDGLRRADGEGDPGPEDPVGALKTILADPADGVYLFKDLNPLLANDPLLRRLVRDAAVRFRTTSKPAPASDDPHRRAPVYKTLVLLSPGGALPLDLREEAESLDWPLPTRDEVAADVVLYARQASPRRAEALLVEQDRVVEACVGLTQVGASNVLARSLVERRAFDIDILLSEKEQAARRSGVVEYVRATEGLDAVGGLEILKAWLVRRRRAFTPEARAFGLPAPKGCLLLGIPGTGKSLCAKAVATAWQLPLLRMDVGRLLGSLVGQSEGNLREALRVAAAIAPCVVWVDEIEKALAGAGTDTSGVTTRIVGQILSWMAERTTEVFVVATANDVAALPPELLRKGRFDEVFFVDLPTRAERAAILAVHLRKRRRAPEGFDLAALAGRCEGFSGAELEQVVVEGLTAAFDTGRDLTGADLARAASEMVPLSRTMVERVEGLRRWAKGRARLASEPEVRTATDGARVVSIDEVR